MVWCESVSLPGSTSLIRVCKPTNEERQFHGSFIHDVGKSFQIFLVALDIYVKLMIIRTAWIYTHICTERNLNKELTCLELHGIMHQIYDNFYKLFMLMVNSIFPVAKTNAIGHVSCFEGAWCVLQLKKLVECRLFVDWSVENVHGA